VRHTAPNATTSAKSPTCSWLVLIASGLCFYDFATESEDLSAAAPTTVAERGIDAVVRGMLAIGQRVQAVKAVRDHYGQGLAHAQAVVARIVSEP